MRPNQIGERVEVDLFGLRATGDWQISSVASGTIVALAPGSITVRLDDQPHEVTIGPARLLGRVS
jgi:hypothetical protein